jgi:hypothetical protein
MTGAWNIVGVLALGALGWFGTSFVGRPLRDFFDLRREVIHKSMLYDNVAATEYILPRCCESFPRPAEALPRRKTPLKRGKSQVRRSAYVRTTPRASLRCSLSR